MAQPREAHVRGIAFEGKRCWPSRLGSRQLYHANAKKANEATWWDMSQAFIFISHAAYGKWPRLQYFPDDTTCPHFCFSVRQFEQSRPDVYVDASQRSVLPLPRRSWSSTALLPCWQTKTPDLEPWLKRRKTKAVKGPPVCTLLPPPGRDRKHNWLDPAVVFCPCFCFSPWLLQTSPFFHSNQRHMRDIPEGQTWRPPAHLITLGHNIVNFWRLNYVV